MSRAAILLAALFLAGCASDEVKLTRIQEEARVLRLNHLVYQQRADSIQSFYEERFMAWVHAKPGRYADWLADAGNLGDSITIIDYSKDTNWLTAMDSLRSIQNRQLLNEREMNRFMNP